MDALYGWAQCSNCCRACPGCVHEQAFKEGDVRFLICTDVAARGIDIQVGFDTVAFMASACMHAHAR